MLQKVPVAIATLAIFATYLIDLYRFLTEN
jgi:hypothetical protein